MEIITTPATSSGRQQVISAARVDHLPIVAHFARRLGLVEMINRLVATQMEVEPGVIALGLVLDTLSGRSPLYHLEKTFEECDRELPAESFSDDNVGRMLDVFYKTGTQRLFSEISVTTLQRFRIATRLVHFDTTSVNLFGDYRAIDGEEPPFTFVTRFPATYNEHDDVILRAIEADDWPGASSCSATCLARTITAPSRSCAPTRSSMPSRRTSAFSRTTRCSTPCFWNVPSGSRHWV